MNRRQQYYLFWVMCCTGLLLIGLGWYFYTQQFGLKKYSDETAGFSIRYPRDWAYASNQHGALAIFYSPAESDYDNFTENVNVSVLDISKNPMDTRQFSATAIRQMEEIFGQDMDIIESTEISLAGKRGHRLVFAGKDPQSLKMLMVWTLRDETVYQVTYTAMADTYLFYLDAVEKMIKTFRLI